MSDQFELLEKLGSGGMGDVFRARDTRLNRIVAVKVLSASSHGDTQRRRRFFQEAQAASALNHPNIITIHDIVSERGDDLIVMECVQGKTLAELIPKGGLRVRTIIDYGLQITDALGAAHIAGIVHRDLKPGNIMVNDRGLVKVLDFGLAKLMDQPLEGADNEATRAGGPLTVEGAIMGTVAYMSPEQAQGKKVDARSDIFSFGAVLYEMATGQRAFQAGSTLSTLTAVLRDETRPILELSPDVPVPLERLIQRCLRKNPDERWQNMPELHSALLALKENSDSGTLYRSFVAPPPLPVPPPSITPPPITPLPSTPPSSRPPSITPSSITSSPITPPSGTQQALPVMRQAAPPPPPVKRKQAAWPKAAISLGVVLLAGGALLAVWWFRQQHPAESPTPAPTATAPTATTPVPQAASPDGVLRNENILEMVRAKVPTSLIIGQIQSSKTDFNLSSAEVIKLVQGGVPEPVIEAMRNPTQVPPAPSNAPPVPAANPKPQPPPTTPLPPTAAGKHPAPVTLPAPAPPTAAPSTASRPSEPALTAVTVADGTPLLLSLAEDVPVDAGEGAELHFTVDADLKVNGATVIRKGAAASGIVVDEAKKRKFFGGNTKVTYRLQTVAAVDGKQLRIRATPAPSTGDAAKRPLENKKSKVQGVAVPKGTELPAYLDGTAVIDVRQ